MISRRDFLQAALAARRWTGAGRLKALAQSQALTEDA